MILEENQSELLKLLRGNLGSILLLDLSMYGNEVEHPFIDTILEKGSQQKIIFVTNLKDSSRLYKLFEKGARGFITSDISSSLMKKAIRAVENGELWIGRKLMAYLIAQLLLEKGEKETESKNGSIEESLTSRETEIARCIAEGKCDKLIARDLNISISTVKSHLQNIFSKLQITSRYQLALIYHGINVNQRFLELQTAENGK
ncbi:MAG: LuxR C-terminal-related transcriptional regulator [Gammaproteobacteria bacterium]